jgi:hypothetical protein
MLKTMGGGPALTSSSMPTANGRTQGS